MAAPIGCNCASTSELSAPLVWSTIFRRSTDSPNELNCATTPGIADSGTEIKMIGAEQIVAESSATARPPPIERTARLAVPSLRVITACIFQPRSRNRWPSALPTRPAPIMEIADFVTVLGYRVGAFEHQSMHLIALILFGTIALFWVVHGLRVALGALQLPWLQDYPTTIDAHCPKVSLLLAARDEEEKLSVALQSLLQINYPSLEIIAANDRSTDGTSKILREAAERDSRLTIVSIAALPDGWLGKPHALQNAYEASTGDWLLFTDADVRFRPDAISRAITLANVKQLDHLTLMSDVEMHGFWERTVLTFFGLGFHLATNPRAASDPRSRAYIGIGAFQLVKRAAYEASG